MKKKLLILPIYLTLSFYPSLTNGQFILANPFPAITDNASRIANGLAINADSLEMYASVGHFLMRSKDNGANWTYLDTLEINNGAGPIAASGDNIYVASYAYNINIHNGKYILWRSTNRGKDWESLSVPWAKDSLGIDYLSSIDSSLFASVRHYGLFRSTDNGINWSIVNNGLPFIPGDFKYYIGQVVTCGTKLFVDAEAIDTTNIFPYNIHSGVFLSIDEGNSWKKVICPVIFPRRIAVSGSNIVVWDLIDTGLGDIAAYLSKDSGSTWRSLPSLSPHSRQPDGPLALVGQNFFASVSSAPGQIWEGDTSGFSDQILSGPDHITDMAISGPNLVIASSFGIWYAPLSAFGISIVNSHSSLFQSLTLLSNPITTSADFQFSPLQAPETFELFDLLGRQLLRRELSIGAASLHVDMHEYPAGVYVARLGFQSVRFVKL